MLRRAMLLMSLAAVAIPPAQAADPAEPFDRRQVLALSQAALGRQVNGDFRFTATDGRVISTADLRGRPLVISLVYSSCYHTCPLVTQNLAAVVEKARAALGEDSFTVATIGFDTPNDTPIRMRQFQKEQSVGDPQWLFLSADAETMRGLTREVGFTYMASTKGFDHLTQATLLDREGRVYRQVYGDKFPPPVLIEPLKELVFATPAGAGLVAQVTNEIKLFCTVFDPTTGKYRFDYSLFVEIFVGLTCLGAVAVFVIRSWRHAA